MRLLTTSIVLALAAVAVARAQDTTSRPAPAAPAPAPTASALTVEQSVVARAVVDRAPQDSGSAFAPDVGQLVLFTKITGGAAGTTIHHVWFHGDEQVADVELHVDGSPWRTWSKKTVPADWTGPWHVEVRDAAGAILKRVDFTVGQ